ncbi:major facilitator superfamily MFS_1 [Thalassoporum mexicanum PCC 7367]|uniref:MFS transporter n=1 Tax=Thalassoporum mexicanum TaxID=3457544 RepID=UPI00029FCC51|nr:MFS transporter [Pseudanabaena sp. PCC 7367]AFY70008.1 major facilitator superfamily MFS_1 [Pseudanabaena sp. PCC 7367]
MTNRPSWWQGLENPIFAKLYLAQLINLAGDSLTWLGLGLLAFEIAGENAGAVLAGALTLRVMAFVVLSPIAGAIADQIDRKRLMVITHLARMGIVCLFPFTTQVWQIYAIVLLLNTFSAFFTPTYKATIPLVTTEAQCPQAIALSSATYQLLGVLGPGLSGSIAALVGTRQIFFLDSITFFISALLIASLPRQLIVAQSQSTARKIHRILKDIRTGTTCLFADPPIRYALVLQLIAAIAGAQILVNTVGYVQGILNLGKVEYGWSMAAFGVGATFASVWLYQSRQQRSAILLTSIGAITITLALLPANLTNLNGLLILWVIAGIGQTLVNVPTQTLIAQRVTVELQGRVYGAHFAWSHLWWAFAYPLAGWIGNRFPSSNFFYSGLIGGGLFCMVYLVFKPQQLSKLKDWLWHEHEHTHDRQHQHQHSTNEAIGQPHNHLHFHLIDPQ